VILRYANSILRFAICQAKSTIVYKSLNVNRLEHVFYGKDFPFQRVILWPIRGSHHFVGFVGFGSEILGLFGVASATTAVNPRIRALRESTPPSGSQKKRT
jgi:hypothetical protein